MTHSAKHVIFPHTSLENGLPSLFRQNIISVPELRFAAKVHD